MADHLPAPFPIGTVLVDPDGTRWTVHMIGTLSGERYAWLLDDGDPTTVSMMPDDVLRETCTQEPTHD